MKINISPLEIHRDRLKQSQSGLLTSFAYVLRVKALRPIQLFHVQIAIYRGEITLQNNLPLWGMPARLTFYADESSELLLRMLSSDKSLCPPEELRQEFL